MRSPLVSDTARPAEGIAPASLAPDAPQEESPPLAPAPDADRSPWWSAPGGKAIGIPDFAHELRALAQLLFAFPPSAPRLVPLRVKARRRDTF